MPAALAGAFELTELGGEAALTDHRRRAGCRAAAGGHLRPRPRHRLGLAGGSESHAVAEDEGRGRTGRLDGEDGDAATDADRA